MLDTCRYTTVPQLFSALISARLQFRKRNRVEIVSWARISNCLAHMSHTNVLRAHVAYMSNRRSKEKLLMYLIKRSNNFSNPKKRPNIHMSSTNITFVGKGFMNTNFPGGRFISSIHQDSGRNLLHILSKTSSNSRKDPYWQLYCFLFFRKFYFEAYEKQEPLHNQATKDSSCL